jgi:ACS family hexuronate transporter-like MFS transporter
LVDVNNLSLVRSAWFASLPPVFAALGAARGGALSFRAMRPEPTPSQRETRVCLLASIVCLVTAAIPWAPTAAWAAAGISVSFFAVAAFSVNMYSMPLDVFSPSRVGFAVSLLTSSYGAMQAVTSPLVGAVVDRYSYTPVCLVASVMPLLAVIILKRTESLR